MQTEYIFTIIEMADTHTNKVIKDVNHIIAKAVKKNARDLNASMIKPLTDDYPFSTNGIYFLCGKMGSGKSYTIMKHILVTDKLFGQPYYDEVIFTSTSGTLDKTVDTMKPLVKTPITFVKDTDLMSYLERLIDKKMEYYSIQKFIESGGTDVDDTMKHIIDTNHMWKVNKRGEKVIDFKMVARYAITKIQEYGFKHYPSYTLLVMDDFAGHPLLKDVNSPLAKMLTKTRHYHLTAVLAVQSWRFVNLNFKRLCSDIIIWKGFSMQDFQRMIEQTPSNVDWKDLWQKYKDLPSNHSNLQINIAANKMSFNR